MKQKAILLVQDIEHTKTRYTTSTDLTELNNYLSDGWIVFSCTSRHVSCDGYVREQGDILIILQKE